MAVFGGDASAAALNGVAALFSDQQSVLSIQPSPYPRRTQVQGICIEYLVFGFYRNPEALSP
jgi:hypothetical protein